MTSIAAIAPHPRAFTLALDAIEPDDHGRVGGKGANLGTLCRAGLAVPPGFCVTTDAYWAFLAGDGDSERPSDGTSGLSALLAALDALPTDDAAAVAGPAAALRAHMRAMPIPAPIARAIASAWRTLGADHAYAVRSSATAEDLPDASFAGQQDTYLEVIGEDALLDRVRACWASLFTDRAILYRQKNRIPHRDVALAVVVQRMVRADKSGILFTADPITGHRDVMAIDAGFGLGEALVSGIVSADLYKLDKPSGRPLEVAVGDKRIAIRPAAGGGTVTEELSGEDRRARVLTDVELTALREVGVRIEALQGCPQDVEWCWEGGALFVVQARPITSLYPLIEPAPADDALRVSFCFNHFQVMTDAMPPMALSLWTLMLPFGKQPGEVAPCPWAGHAGGRLFVDVSRLLRNRVARGLLLRGLTNVDALAAAGLAELAHRPELARGPRVRLGALLGFAMPRLAEVMGHLWVRDPDGAAARELAWIDRRVAEIAARIERCGADRAARLRALREEVSRLFWDASRLIPMVFASLVAKALLRRLVGESAGGAGAAGEAGALVDAIARGLFGNVTTEMDLAVGDLADIARGVPAVREAVAGGASLDELRALPEASAFVAAIEQFLSRYGCRGPSEIDVSRPRWNDDPSSILQVIAGNLRHDEPGQHRAHHAALVAAADEAVEAILASVRRGVLGPARVRIARRLIAVIRGLMALREHPKFYLVRALDLARSELLRAGRALADAGYVDRADDIFMLSLDEAIAVLGTPGALGARGARDAGARAARSPRVVTADAAGSSRGPGAASLHDLRAVIAARRAAHERHQSLYPPRVMTSRGECPTFAHSDDGAPAGALIGSPASSGVVEGVARVVRDPTREVLHKGEILIAPFTDPGWTPLFINAAGLVMEVGGLMTHGSVVAREYGIPAVVCVPDATRAIQTGQRVRVDGSRGHVIILPDEPAPASEETRP